VKVSLRKGPASGLGPFEGRFESANGETLRIEADGSFSYRQMLCFGEDGKFGIARLEGGRLRFSPVGRDIFGDHHLKTVYEPVRWGGRLYLVPSETMDQFCRMAIDVRESRRASSSFLCRVTDPDEPPRGVPEVPAPYRHYFQDRKNPVMPIPLNW
jgi:hypothetical protein